MIESLRAGGLSHRQARDAVDALHADHHNLWATLEGNTAESDVRWFARQVYEETRREVCEPFKRFDDLDDFERSRWERVASACLARLPFLMSRVANRCKAIADATRLVVQKLKEETS
jgi:hypothetical protein